MLQQQWVGMEWILSQLGGQAIELASLSQHLETQQGKVFQAIKATWAEGAKVAQSSLLCWPVEPGGGAV